MENINNLAKQSRLDCNISLAHIARELNLPQSNISMFESGKNRSGKILNWYLMNTNLPEKIEKMKNGK